MEPPAKGPHAPPPQAAGQPERFSRSDHGSLGAPSGFEHNARGLHSLEPHHEGGNPGGIVAHRPAFTGRAHSNIALGFGDINTNKDV